MLDNFEKLFMFGGSKEFRVEYNVPDCQGGWAVVKDGTGQVIGCHKTEADANAHRDSLITEMTDILGQEVRTAKTPPEVHEDEVRVNKSYEPSSIWDGVFFPSKAGTMGPNNGSVGQDMGWKSTFNTPPEKDGTSNVGYGNQSGGTNPH